MYCTHRFYYFLKTVYLYIACSYVFFEWKFNKICDLFRAYEKGNLYKNEYLPVSKTEQNLLLLCYQTVVLVADLLVARSYRVTNLEPH